MKIALSHPSGNEFVRAAANALATENMLGKFYTSIYSFPGTTLDHISKYSPFSEIKRRQFDPILQPYTEMVLPWLEAGRLLAPKVGLTQLIRQENSLFSTYRVYREFDKAVANKLTPDKFDAVYAYEDGALSSFIKAKSLGISRFYDLSIGYWRTARILLEKEREKWPDWASTLTGFSDSEEKLARKDEELSLASQIFVASKFTAKTLENYPGSLAPIEIVPYGFPPPIGGREYEKFSKNRKLKLLFVGGLSQRKGIADLFSVVDKLKGHVELTVIGRKPKDNCQVLNEALSKFHWIESMPHSEILKTMRQHDVLVFPSLFEGFGLVITEAMSQGTPVITTDRTAGPEFIEHGKNGWITEAGSTQALQATIEHILSHPETIAQSGKAALETAGKRPWSRYGHELTAALKNVYLGVK